MAIHNLAIVIVVHASLGGAALRQCIGKLVALLKAPPGISNKASLTVVCANLAVCGQCPALHALRQRSRLNGVIVAIVIDVF